MAFPGETLGGRIHQCGHGTDDIPREPWEDHPPHDIPLAVHQSGAGYYIGYWCDVLGPISRESGYYPTREAAQAELEAGFEPRDTEFHPGPMEIVRIKDSDPDPVERLWRYLHPEEAAELDEDEARWPEPPEEE